MPPNRGQAAKFSPSPQTVATGSSRTAVRRANHSATTETCSFVQTMNILIVNQSVIDMCASFFTLLTAAVEVDGNEHVPMRPLATDDNVHVSLSVSVSCLCLQCHCHSLSLASVKSRLALPFWYRFTWVVPEKGR